MTFTKSESQFNFEDENNTSDIMINSIKQIYGSQNTEIIIDILKQYDLQNISASTQRKMKERVNQAVALIGKEDESQTAEIINLVASYLIYLKNFNL